MRGSHSHQKVVEAMGKAMGVKPKSPGVSKSGSKKKTKKTKKGY